MKCWITRLAAAIRCTGLALSMAVPVQAQITLIPGPQSQISQSPEYLAVADFNGDGFQDVVVSNDLEDKATVLRLGTVNLSTPLRDFRGAKSRTRCCWRCQVGSYCEEQERVCCDVLNCPSGYSCRVPCHEGICTLVPPPPTLSPTLTGAPTRTPTPTPKPAVITCSYPTPCSAPGLFCEMDESVCCDQVDCPSGSSCRVPGHEGICTRLPLSPTPSPSVTAATNTPTATARSNGAGGGCAMLGGARG